ncbi:MAG: hypothetical protein B7Z13_04185 [Caulobacterales bacterium 32-67-6]|nr:MAG: hypothetical protein B7Z13_04185 [Caulobacterales bacterium 32-67-6]
MATPAHPKIYHITHVTNLAGIIANGGLRSDALMVAAGGPTQTIGMSSIKSRRLSLPVRCHQGDTVGQYVPFYFCSRSIMLYLLHKGNHPEVDYKGGQTPIVHLEADLGEAVAWAQANGRRWAFTLSNAGAYYAEFRDDLAALGEVRWEAVASTQWSAPDVREGKQAEFLMRDDFPWELFSRVGVQTMPMKLQVDAILANAAHKPKVDLVPGWYY